MIEKYVYIYPTVRIPEEVRKSLQLQFLEIVQELPELRNIFTDEKVSENDEIFNEEYHISLSRCLPIRFPQITPILGLLEHQLKGIKP